MKIANSLCSHINNLFLMQEGDKSLRLVSVLRSILSKILAAGLTLGDARFKKGLRYPRRRRQMQKQAAEGAENIAFALATEVEASIESNRANLFAHGIFDALFPGNFNSSAAPSRKISKRHRERVRMMRSQTWKRKSMRLE